MLNSNREPLISVVTVVYNGAKYIESAINSILNQTYKNIEYIVIDGGSTDGTQEIIKKYEEHIKYWVSEKDKGIYDAMNKGIEKCTGVYIGILNSDDYYEKNTCKIIKNAIIQDPIVDIFHGNVKHVNKDGELIFISKPKSENKLKSGMVIRHPSCFVSNKWYNKIGKYDIKLSIASDFKFLYLSYKNGAKFKYIDFIASNMREGGISDVQAKKGWKEVETICLDLGDSKLLVLYYSITRSLKYYINKKILKRF